MDSICTRKGGILDLMSDPILNVDRIQASGNADLMIPTLTRWRVQEDSRWFQWASHAQYFPQFIHDECMWLYTLYKHIKNAKYEEYTDLIGSQKESGDKEEAEHIINTGGIPALQLCFSCFLDQCHEKGRYSSSWMKKTRTRMGNVIAFWLPWTGENGLALMNEAIRSKVSLDLYDIIVKVVANNIFLFQKEDIVALMNTQWRTHTKEDALERVCQFSGLGAWLSRIAERNCVSAEKCEPTDKGAKNCGEMDVDGECVISDVRRGIRRGRRDGGVGDDDDEANTFGRFMKILNVSVGSGGNGVDGSCVEQIQSIAREILDLAGTSHVIDQKYIKYIVDGLHALQADDLRAEMEECWESIVLGFCSHSVSSSSSQMRIIGQKMERGLRVLMIVFNVMEIESKERGFFNRVQWRMKLWEAIIEGSDFGCIPACVMEELQWIPYAHVWSWLSIHRKCIFNVFSSSLLQVFPFALSNGGMEMTEGICYSIRERVFESTGSLGRLANFATTKDGWFHHIKPSINTSCVGGGAQMEDSLDSVATVTSPNDHMGMEMEMGGNGKKDEEDFITEWNQCFAWAPVAMMVHHAREFGLSSYCFVDPRLVLEQHLSALLSSRTFTQCVLCLLDRILSQCWRDEEDMDDDAGIGEVAQAYGESMSGRVALYLLEIAMEAIHHHHSNCNVIWKEIAKRLHTIFLKRPSAIHLVQKIGYSTSIVPFFVRDVPSMHVAIETLKSCNNVGRGIEDEEDRWCFRMRLMGSLLALYPTEQCQRVAENVVHALRMQIKSGQLSSFQRISECLKIICDENEKMCSLIDQNLIL
eukprot:TRINITY_DN7995_c0_g1_i1.p1 TRINITY_DN7995_c0_g1~~TRINITY_DN7995_c0_g1_i1.p1  ORF type:complete len:813 (+),score=200.79 TRINITY_DN7995_c0_g1_i1:64-2502(+)